MSTPFAQTANAAVPARPSASKFKPVRLLQTPSVLLLLLWMIVPLAMTLYFSVIRYNLMMPEATGFVGLDNYAFLLSDPAFWPSILNTLLLIGSVLVISVVGGTLLAVLFDQPFFGRGIARLLVIGPFFVMPTVAALIWKNMILHPVYGLLAWAMRLVGLEPIDWLAEYPMLSVIMIVAWQWIPFAFLILLTALQSLDMEQKEAAQLDGAGPVRVFWYVVLPHLKRAITVVIMIETIFLLSIFAEIFTTTAGGPGTATTNLAYLVYSIGLQQFDIGIASAGGIIAVVLANIVSFFLVRMMAKNLKGANEK
ncbi:carbohydrate ABC transporter permease [Collimonas pratensis]|uniref:Binding--dependent transport system inner membrane component family protein n=1 Tax=Collimonas pratensis TaxID=279113 RepID=A0ABM5ZAY0_9BURK|nr:sugar ABC transporter permease [Collimonas pratensis]AMP16237.1 binding--dependent transport system inner membrane component family protein [Collimonas pratensis]NKI70573.1 ABC transporter permease subunit [Collimonas pratensis]